MKQLLAALFLGLVALTPRALAHHSTAIYDMEQSVTVDGIVTRYDWANPHVYIYVEQIADAGEMIEWEVEAYPPALMWRGGWSERTLRTGDSVTVTGNPTRSATNRGIYPARIEAGDHTLFERTNMREQLSRASVEAEVGASSLDGTWETLTSFELILHFYNPGMKLTEAGRAAHESYDERTMLPALDCIPYSAPLLMIDPDFKQITLGEDVITIQGGYAAAVRTIHLKAVTHDGVSRTMQGHSVGRWDGNSLFIDTTHFADHRIGNGYRGVTSGSQKHLVERLTLNEDRTRLRYEFELTDPEFLREPVNGEVEWAYRPDLEFIREECEFDNARRFVEGESE